LRRADIQSFILSGAGCGSGFRSPFLSRCWHDTMWIHGTGRISLLTVGPGKGTATGKDGGIYGKREQHGQEGEDRA
jgi:hypothetical protein